MAEELVAGESWGNLLEKHFTWKDSKLVKSEVAIASRMDWFIVSLELGGVVKRAKGICWSVDNHSASGTGQLVICFQRIETGCLPLSIP